MFVLYLTCQQPKPCILMSTHMNTVSVCAAVSVGSRLFWLMAYGAACLPDCLYSESCLSATCLALTLSTPLSVLARPLRVLFFSFSWPGSLAQLKHLDAYKKVKPALHQDSFPARQRCVGKPKPLGSWSREKSEWERGRESERDREGGRQSYTL